MNSGGPHSGNSLGGDDCCHLKQRNPWFSEVKLLLLGGAIQKWDVDFLIPCITLSISYLSLSKSIFFQLKFWKDGWNKEKTWKHDHSFPCLLPRLYSQISAALGLQSRALLLISSIKVALPAANPMPFCIAQMQEGMDLHLNQYLI